MTYNPNNPNGQATMANSAPVVVASDQSAIPHTASSLSVAYTTTTVQAVGSTDAANYRWVSVQVNTQGGSSTITFQGSNDNSTWVSLGLNRADNISTTGGGTGNVYASTTATGVWYGALNCRYFRLNVTGIASGTTAGTIVFSSAPAITTVPTVTAVQNGTWTVQPGNTPNTSAWLTSNVAATTGGYSFLHIAAGQATTTVKSGAGTLHAIVFNGAATATNVTTIYDNTAGSGTIIGIPAATAVTTPESVIYDLAFTTGLTIVTATANGSDMTVIYK